MLKGDDPIISIILQGLKHSLWGQENVSDCRYTDYTPTQQTLRITRNLHQNVGHGVVKPCSYFTQDNRMHQNDGIFWGS